LFPQKFKTGTAAIVPAASGQSEPEKFAEPGTFRQFMHPTRRGLADRSEAANPPAHNFESNAPLIPQRTRFPTTNSKYRTSSGLQKI